jgi:D-arginine dehydrogenase
METGFDIIVIGAGIAGASAAAHLAETHRVLVLEMEERPGYHSTGRSAAAFEPNYGPAPIRALSRAARGVFDALGALTPRDTLFFMPPGQEKNFAALMAAQQGMREIPVSEARKVFPLLRPDYADRAILDPGTADIDVDLVHQFYLKKLKSGNGTVLCSHPVTAITRGGGTWELVAGGKTFSARIIVNAAGAWGDVVAKLASAKPVGLQPRRRSIAVVPPPDGYDAMAWPLVGDVGETWYAKPQSGKLLVSPADATPVEPHDAYADDMTLAEGIDRFQQAVSFEVTRVEHTWGGLRSFVPDGNPVVGYDAKHEGLFWLIGQGGYGIQTSPALSRVAAALVRREAVPADITAEGFDATSLSPSRFG